jgi:VanZ family protein
MTRLKFFLKYWLPLLVYASCLLYLSALPETTFPDVSLTGFDDKIIHFVQFAFLTLFIYRLIINGKWQSGIVHCSVVSFLLSSFYGTIHEVFQMFVPSRHGSLFDLAADMVGSLFMILLIRKGFLLRTSHS